MKKTLKTIALVTVTWTVAEFVTMWRMQDQPLTLKQFTKTYFKGQKMGWDAVNALANDPDISSSVKDDMRFIANAKFYPEA